METEMLPDSSQMLYYVMNIIDTKLRISPSLLNMEDVEFAKNIVLCFNQILNWREAYPELMTHLNDEFFRSIFMNMSSYFSSTGDAELIVECQFCDVVFPLLNSDLSLSYDMHKQEPKHLEIVNMFNELHSLSLQDPTTTNQSDNQGDMNGLAAPSASCDDLCGTQGIARSTEESKQKKVSVLPIPANFSENELTGSVSNGGDVNCMATPDPASYDTLSIALSNLENQFERRVSSIAGIYTSNDESRLTYFLNKICILHSNPDYRCGFCDLVITENANCVSAHLGSSSHEAALTRVISNIDPKCATIEPSIFIPLGQRVPRCHLCVQDILFENNPVNYFAHVRTCRHLSKIKVHFKSPLFEDWERGIILRNGRPYCVVCESVLASEASMREHLSEAEHQSKLQ